MMFKDLRGGVCSDTDLCVLAVTSNVLDLPNVIIADRNASTDMVSFKPSPGGLLLIDSLMIYAMYWNHQDDPVATTRHKALICAEVLVPDEVSAQYVVGAYVSCTEAKNRLLALAPTLTVKARPDLFFK